MLGEANNIPIAQGFGKMFADMRDLSGFASSIAEMIEEIRDIIEDWPAGMEAVLESYFGDMASVVREVLGKQLLSDDFWEQKPDNNVASPPLPSNQSNPTPTDNSKGGFLDVIKEAMANIFSKNMPNVIKSIVSSIGPAASRGISSVVGTITARLGPVGTTVLGLTGAVTIAAVVFKKLSDAALAAAENTLEFARYLADASPSMAYLAEKFNVQEFMRNFRLGEATGESTGGVLDALSDFRDAILPIQVMLSEIKNTIVGSLVSFLARFAEFIKSSLMSIIELLGYLPVIGDNAKRMLKKMEDADNNQDNPDFELHKYIQQLADLELGRQRRELAAPRRRVK